MKRRMIEIEYTREGVAKVYPRDPIDGYRYEKRLPDIRIGQHTRRKRRMPGKPVERLKEILSRPFSIKGESETGSPIWIVLPPARLIREQEIVIEYKGWKECGNG